MHVKMLLIERWSIEWNHFFSRFIGLEWLNTHTCMCQNACLFKYPHNHSNLGLK